MRFLSLLAVLFVFPLSAWGATATCTWTDMSSGSSQEDYFILERAPSSGGPFTDLTHPPQNATSYADMTVSAGSTYCYRIKGVNTAGSGSYSNIDCFTVPAGTVGVPGMTCSYADVAAPTGLVLAMSFNAGSGTTAADSSGANNHGTLTNGPVWTTAGKYSDALTFDGSNDHLVIPDAATLDLGTTGTLMAWVKLDALGLWHGVLAKGTTNTENAHNYALLIGDTTAYCILGSGSASQYVTTTVSAAGVWQHLACTWDAATLKIYKEGTLAASVARTVTPAGNTSPLYIGQYGGNVDRLDGTIDEPRIYNRTLTQSEIQTDMNTPIP